MTDRSRLRLFVLRIVVVTLLGTLLGRLWYLQVIAGDRYSRAAADNRIREVVTPAARGQVLDDRGVPLVRNRSALVVSVNRSELPTKAADREAVLRRLATVVGIPYEELVQKITPCGGSVRPPCWNGSPYQPVPVKEDAAVEMALAISERREDFPGVTADVQAVRDYPQGRLAAHTLGYVSPISEAELGQPRYADYRRTDTVGRSGLEQQYDTDLRGRPGIREVAVDHVGNVVGVLKDTPATPGANLVLSLDASVQKVAEDALGHAIQNARGLTDTSVLKGQPFKATAGAAVVLEAKTGRVVALASYPSYDPSVFVGGVSSRDYAALTDEKAGVPLLSRATQGQFAPGSTFKISSAAAAVGDGNPLNGIYACPKDLQVGNQTFKNFEGEQFGNITLRTALVHSCDTVFYQFGIGEWQKDEARIAAKQPPTEPMAHMARAFGFGADTGIDLPGESPGTIVDRGVKLADWKARKDDYCAGAKSRPPGSYLQQLDAENCADGYKYRGGDAVLFAIGQGDVLVTPLQLATAYAAVANGGTVHPPQLAKAVVDADGNPVRTIDPKPARQLPVDPATLAYIRDALTGVVTEGTAAGAYAGFPLDRLPVAGKTGTAEVTGKQDTSWFASFAPANDPQYVVVGMVAEAGQGGQVAAPMTREIWAGIYGLEGRPPLAPLPSTLPKPQLDGAGTGQR